MTTCTCNLSNIENKLDLINGGIMQLNNTTNEMFNFLKNNVNGGNNENPDTPVEPIVPSEPSEIEKWNYTLDDINNVVTISSLKNNSELANIEIGDELIMYDKYIINDKEYTTKFVPSVNSGYIIPTQCSTITFGNFIDISEITRVRNFISNNKLTKVNWGIFKENNITSIEELFYNIPLVKSLDQILNGFSFKNVTNIDQLIVNYNNDAILSDISFLNNIDFSKMENVRSLIYGKNKIVSADITMNISNLKSLLNGTILLYGDETNEPIDTFTLTLSGSKTEAVDLKFFMIQSFNKIIIKTSEDNNLVLNGEGFVDNVNVKIVDISGFKPYKLVNTKEMFRSKYITEIIGIEDLDMSNVIDMNNMFSYCLVESLDLSNWNLENVEKMYALFKNASKLKYLNISNWKIPKVTSLYDLLYITNSELIELIGINDLDTSNITDMRSLFEGCKKLTSLDLTNWNVSKVKYFNSMFSSCSSLGQILVSRDKWVVSSTANTTSMFILCKVSSVTYAD